MDSLARSQSIKRAQRQLTRIQRIRKTLEDDYPGLDFLGFTSVFRAKYRWYQALWFAILVVCLFLGLYTIYRVIREFAQVPSATLYTVKSVDRLRIPQVTICPTHPATLNLSLLHETMIRYPALDIEDNETTRDFGTFMIAGSGFQKMEPILASWNDTYLRRLANAYSMLKRRNTTTDFFNWFFDRFGLQCEHFFHFCKLGSKEISCCTIFRPTYAIRRGRCFYTQQRLHQVSYDEMGKFRVQLRSPPNALEHATQANEIILFIAEPKPDISPFPRYYLYAGQYNKLRLAAKHLSLLPREQVCSNEHSNLGKATCYLERWFISSLESRFRCTYPYMHLFRSTNLPSCDPMVLIKNYQSTVTSEGYNFHNVGHFSHPIGSYLNSDLRCTLSCDRWEYTIEIERTPAPPNDDVATGGIGAGFKEYMFRADIAYNDLQYEELTEVVTVTFSGLVSQIGGQLSLFLGASIINIAQLSLLTALICGRGIRRRFVVRTSPNAPGNNASALPQTMIDVNESAQASNIHRDSLWTALPMRAVDQRVVY